MQWIRFDEADHREAAPDFCLLSQAGESVCLSRYHEDASLAVIFAPQNGKLPVRLSGFTERLEQYRVEGAQVLVVFAGQPGSPNIQEYGQTPFPLLADPGSQARQTYARLMADHLSTPQDLMIFVLDCYRAPYAAVVGQTFDEATLHIDILKWLQFIGMQCPE